MILPGGNVWISGKAIRHIPKRLLNNLWITVNDEQVKRVKFYTCRSGHLHFKTRLFFGATKDVTITGGNKFLKAIIGRETVKP